MKEIQPSDERTEKVKSSLKAFAVIAVLLVLLVAAAVAYRLKRPQFETQSFIAMDTPVTIKVLDCDADKIRDIVEELDDALDAYSSDSELYSINRSGEGKSEIASDVLLKLEKITAKHTLPTAGRVIELWAITSDNAKVPSDSELLSALQTVKADNLSLNDNIITLKNGSYLNFGYCAKGYACDEIKEYLESNDVKCAVVSLGSSSLLFGEKPDGKPFKTAVTNPFSPSQNMLYVQTDACAISTSGGYERYSDIDGKRYGHIFDLETGYPAETDLASVTVICQSAIASDVLATEIYIGGTEELSAHLASEEYQIIAVDMNKNVYVSQSLKDSVTITDSQFKLK